MAPSVGNHWEGCESALPICLTSKLITMARSITRMARVAVDLFEPKQVARGRIIIRKYGLTDTMLEVNETKAMTMLVNFVVFQVIGHRIDKVGWDVEDMLQKKINWWCEQDCEGSVWPSNAGLRYEVWYISRRIIRHFLNSVSQK